MQTGLVRVQTGPICAPTGPGCAHMQAGRATTDLGRAQTHATHAQMDPKSQKTLEGHISVKTCPNRAFEVFFGIYRKFRCQKHLKRPIRPSFE